jgi:soluble lytic murein transglycosylase-like protein
VIGVLFILALLAAGGRPDPGAVYDLWSTRLQDAYAAVLAAGDAPAPTPPPTQTVAANTELGPLLADAAVAAEHGLAAGLAAYHEALPSPPLAQERPETVALGPLLARGVATVAQAAADGLDGYRIALHDAAPPPQAAPRDPALASLITEASGRFDLPELWIRAVMQVESNGDIDATSPKGAMGLMQVMPATYAYLSDRYGLGDDPYAPRDNVLAGSAYLRELYDRYGAAGFLAAYNAGPGRYEDSLCRGCTLPEETKRYVSSVRLALGEVLFGHPHSQFYQPLAIASDGALLLSRTGEPVPVAERLALHSLVERAVRRAAGTK